MLLGRYTRVGSLRVFEVRSGAGPGVPVVGVHGLSVSTRYMRRVLEAIARERPVLAPDLPGFGRSEQPPAILDVGGLAAFLLDWLDASGVTRAVLLGHSLGCQVACEAAVRRPALVAGLLLVGPTADPAAPTLRRHAARLALDILREPPALTALVARDYLRTGFARTLATARHMLEHDLRAVLPLIAVPAVVARGDRDPIVPQRWVESVASLLPGASTAVVQGAAHAAHWSRPDEVAGLLTRLSDTTSKLYG